MFLKRRDTARRMAGFYRVALQPALPFNGAPARVLVPAYLAKAVGGICRSRGMK